MQVENVAFYHLDGGLCFAIRNNERFKLLSSSLGGQQEIEISSEDIQKIVNIINADRLNRKVSETFKESVTKTSK